MCKITAEFFRDNSGIASAPISRRTLAQKLEYSVPIIDAGMPVYCLETDLIEAGALKEVIRKCASAATATLKSKLKRHSRMR